MPDHAWKAEERRAARPLGGHCHPPNTGGCVDVEAAGVLAQAKHRRTLSLGALEMLAVEAAEAGRMRGKLGILVVKRRADRGRPTTRMVVMTEAAWRLLHCDQFGALPQDIGAP